MQATKECKYQLKFDDYFIEIAAFNEKLLGLKVIDTLNMIEFNENMLGLTNIGTSTLIKAFSKSHIQIRVRMIVKKTAETAILQIEILVVSQFLIPVQETIYIKKSRDVDQSQILRHLMRRINSKIKQIKNHEKSSMNVVKCGKVQNDNKSFKDGQKNVPIANIKLPKGKYLLTLSFLMRAKKSFMYIYFQESQQIVQHSGFYVPSPKSYTSMLLRKSYVVNYDEEDIQFSTFSCQGYPVVLRNVILTAQAIQ